MNLLECKVLEIFSQVKYNGGYVVKMKYTSYGVESITKIWLKNSL